MPPHLLLSRSRSLPCVLRHGPLVSALFLTLLLASCGQADGRTTGTTVEEPSFWSRLMATHEVPMKDCGEMEEWRKEHGKGMRAKLERDGFVMELSYRPAVCIACEEMPGSSFADSVFRDRVRQLGRNELYALRITEARSSMDHVPMDLSDAIGSELVEVIGGDTVPCSFVHIEAVPSLVPYRSVLIGFDRGQDGSDRQVVWLDKQQRFGGSLVFDLKDGTIRAMETAIGDTTLIKRS